VNSVPHTLQERFAGRHQVTVTWVVLACLAVTGQAPGSVAATPALKRDCSATALAFSETLEPVIEAVIDGQPNKVQLAADRAQAWWAAHRAGWMNAATVDSAMRELELQASAHHASLAARAAVRASTAALDACPDPPTLAANMMRVDLAGMAGWLRAHGVNTPFPRNVEQAAEAIGDRLRAGGHEALAGRLAREVAATLVIPVRMNGDLRAANALLARVDEAEQATP